MKDDLLAALVKAKYNSLWVLALILAHIMFVKTLIYNM
jgi:hypothetical protein